MRLDQSQLSRAAYFQFENPTSDVCDSREWLKSLPTVASAKHEAVRLNFKFVLLYIIRFNILLNKQSNTYPYLIIVNADMNNLVSPTFIVT